LQGEEKAELPPGEKKRSSFGNQKVERPFRGGNERGKGNIHQPVEGKVKKGKGTQLGPGNRTGGERASLLRKNHSREKKKPPSPPLREKKTRKRRQGRKGKAPPPCRTRRPISLLSLRTHQPRAKKAEKQGKKVSSLEKMSFRHMF